MAVELVSETFADRVGDEFEVTPAAGGEPFPALLSACDEAHYGSAEELREQLGRVPFSLLFHATHRDGYWPQQTFNLRHPELGEFPLFMVPLGPDDRGMRYEAVIS